MTAALSDLCERWSAELFTRSGTALSVRPAVPDDKSLVEDFFRHVGPDDLRFRFLAAIRMVDDSRIAALCAIDVPRFITFLAFHDGQLAAVATLAGDPATRKAEVALSTRPEWKHQGVSWTLLEHLIRFARAQDYEEIVSIEKADNEGALGVERDMGFTLSLVDDDCGEVTARKAILFD